MTAVDEIKARLDIVDLVSESVKLRRSGKSYTGFCPFHPNTRTPAFVVFPDSGTWRCFGQCNEGGDIFKYVMKKEGWDFSQALEFLAQRAGVTLEARTPEREAADEQNDRLRDLLEQTAAFFSHHLLHSDAGRPALDYLHKRGLTDETIQTFGLGYAPASWDAARQHFMALGFSQAEMLQAGLLSESPDTGRVYDRFRNRVTFPIRDSRGRMTGFGARILDPNDIPKFLNSPQTPLFDKGSLLYALDLARKDIRVKDQAVIVEGYLDVIALHQAGFRNTVSPMGTALSEAQLHLLKRLTRRIVLALDADAAGEKATLRGLEIARQALDHETELVFDARGLIRQEARLSADVRVTRLPPGMDPDEVVLRNPAEWQAILDAAQPIVVHVMDTLAAGRDLDDAKVKSEIAAQVLPLVEDVPDMVEREAYRQRLARLLRVDERSLLGGRPAARPAPAGRRRKPSPAQSARPQTPVLLPTSALRAQELEHHILRLLMRQPDTLFLLNRHLHASKLPPLAPEDFERGDFQTLSRLLLQGVEQDQMEAHHYVREHAPESLAETLEEMFRPLPFGEPTAEECLEDLARSLLSLRLVRINSAIDQIQLMQRDLEEQGDDSLRTYYAIVVQYHRTRQLLDSALQKPIQPD